VSAKLLVKKKWIFIEYSLWNPLSFSLFFTEDCILVFTSFFCKQEATFFNNQHAFLYISKGKNIHSSSHKVTITLFENICFLLLEEIQIAGVCTAICFMWKYTSKKICTIRLPLAAILTIFFQTLNMWVQGKKT